VPSETNQSPEQVSVISVVRMARRLHHFHIVRTAAGPGSRNAHRFVLLRPLRLRRRRRRRAHFRGGPDHQSSEQVRPQRRRRLVEGRVGRSRRQFPLTGGGGVRRIRRTSDEPVGRDSAPVGTASLHPA
jgi:hypothetical protein